MAITYDEETRTMTLEEAADVERLGEAAAQVATRSRRRPGPLPGQGAMFPRPAPSWEELGLQLDRVEELRSAWQIAKEQAKLLKAEHDQAAEQLRNMRVRQRYRHVDLHTGEIAEGRS